MSPLITPIQNAIDSYTGSVYSAICGIDSEAHSKGTVSAVAGANLLSALIGDFFTLIVIVAVAVSLGLLALQIITGGMSFVITTIIGIVVGYIISEMLKAAQQGAFDDLIPPIDMDGIQQWIEDMLGDRMPSDTQTGVTAFGVCMDIAGMFFGFGTFVLAGVNFANECLWLIYSIISIVISIEATILNSDLFALVALAIAGGALAHSMLEIKRSSSANGKIINAISASFGGIAIVTDLLYFDS